MRRLRIWHKQIHDELEKKPWQLVNSLCVSINLCPAHRPGGGGEGKLWLIRDHRLTRQGVHTGKFSRDLQSLATLYSTNLLQIYCCSVAKLYLTLCNPMDYSTPSFPVLHYILKFAQTHVHWVYDAIQLFHSLLPPSPPALNFSQHQGLFQWVTSLH